MGVYKSKLSDILVSKWTTFFLITCAFLITPTLASTFSRHYQTSNDNLEVETERVSQTIY